MEFQFGLVAKVPVAADGVTAMSAFAATDLYTTKVFSYNAF
jgi:hypothetical protein